MKKILLLLSIAFIGCSATAQISEKSAETLTISMNATEYLPADQIIFNINITAEGDTPEEAFEAHKKMETLLASSLKEMEFKREDIRYQPVRISLRSVNYDQNNRDKYSVTNQPVSLTFSDFSKYEALQIALIENGFNSFNATFSSSELDAGKNTALIKAIETAKEKARLIAETSGVKIAGIKAINYGDYTVTPQGNVRYRMAAEFDAAPSMMDFDQTVSVSTSITIEFYLDS